jgi:hypothetical protein
MLNVESLSAMKCIKWTVSWQSRQALVALREACFVKLFLLGAIHGSRWLPEGFNVFLVCSG